MRLGVSSYSFTGAVRAGRLDFLDIPAMAAEIGFDEIEFSVFIKPENTSTRDYAAKLVDACAKAGIPIGNYAVSGELVAGSNDDLDAEIVRLKEEVEVASILGSPRIRHDAARGIPDTYPRYTGFDDVLPRLADGCRAITEYAATKGIKTMVENHGYFAQDSKRVEKLVRAVAHENFGLLIDIGNFVCVDEKPEIAVGRLATYAFHVHAKDFHLKSGNSIDPGEGWAVSRGGNYWRGAIAGHGDLNLYQCMKILKRAGYDGTVSMEFEGLEESIRGVEIGYANLRRYHEMLGV